MTLEQNFDLHSSDAKSEGANSTLRNGALLIIVSVMALLLLIINLGGRSTRAPFPVEGSPEVGFARDMSLHHSQAVNMAQLLYDRTQNPTLQSIALDIMLTQQAQIGQISGWLDIWGLPKASNALPMTWMDTPTEGMMPGMAMDEQIEVLQASNGVEADRLFIQLMIAHHQGGIHMAEAILERTDNLAVETLAQSIRRSQQIEIDQMTLLLAQIDASDTVPTMPGMADMPSMPTTTP